MDSSVDIGTIILIVIRDRLNDLPWFLSGRSVVKIDDRLILNQPIQEREIFPNR